MGLLDAPGLTRTAQATTFRRVIALRRCHDALLAGNLDMVHDGHSITEGAGASAVGQRWPDDLTTRLRALFQPLGITGGAGYVPSTSTYTAPYASTWSFTGGTPTPLSADGLGRYAVSLVNGMTATLTFTGTAIRLHYTGYNGGPSVPVTIDGTSVANMAVTRSVTDYGATTTYSGLAAGSHTIVLSSPGTVNFHGAMVFNGDETRGIRTYNSGHSGDSLSAVTDGNPPLRQLPLFSVLAPQLITIEYAVNEYRGNITPAVFKSNLRKRIDQLRGVTAPPPSIVIVSDVEPLHGGTPANPWSAFKTAMVQAAAEKNCGLLDLDGKGVTLLGDQVHPNPAGHAAIGTALTAYLTQDLLAA